MPAGSITVVGLGPGPVALLTLEARETLARAPEVWLRTRRHPTVGGLPPGPRYESFDEVYEREASFEAVYATIVTRVLELARRDAGVVYAVPGHPLFGEATVRSLLVRSRDEGLALRILPGVSFLDTVTVALGLDPLDDGLLVLDALDLHERSRRLVPQRPTVVAQVYDQRAASQVKLAMLEAYPPEHGVRIVRGDGTTVATEIARLDHDGSLFDHLVTLYVPPLALNEDVRTFEGLRAIVAKLRSPDGGCPWDLEQTHESLKRYLIEEAYEALEALDEGEPKKMAEELGDLLFQVLIHAQLGEDEGAFAIEDVITSIAAKLVRRHPHVFGDLAVEGAQEVLRNWETLKKAERGDAPLLAAVPKALPALLQAQSVQSRASKAGLEAARAADAAGEAIASRLEPRSAISEEALGEVLFAIVAAARRHGIDAEEALRRRIARFREEVAAEEERTDSAESA